MPYLYLIGAVLLYASENILCAFFNRKYDDKKDVGAFCTLLISISSFLSWGVLFLFDGTWDWAVLPYALLFSLGFTLATVMLVEALKCGPVVLTSLIMQLSLIGATVWGFFSWGDNFTWLVGVGLALVVVALWLCLYTGEKEEQKFSVKWLLCVLLMFLGNACGTIVQKTQQLDFDGKYGNFLMVVATGIMLVVSVIRYLKSDKSDSKVMLRSWYYPVSVGVVTAIANLCVILLATSPLSPSLIYPVLSVGVLMVNSFFSAFVFKEKMRWWQWVGVAVGTAAVAILSI